MIALERDRTFVVLGEVFHLAELALGDTAVEIFTAQHVIKILHAIDDVFALLGRNHDAHVIPFANGFGGVERLSRFGIHGRFIQTVEPSATLGIFRSHVVLELDLGAGAPNRLSRFGDVKHDAAVARVRDVVFQLEFEPLELIRRDNVTGVLGINTSECSVLRLPTRTDGAGPEITPTTQIVAVE